VASADWKEKRFRRVMLRWARERARSFPWREQTDTYRVLVGEILLQRTRGEHVVEAYQRFVERWPRPEALAKANRSQIKAVIRPLGLARRAQLLKRLGQELTTLGEVPRSPEALLNLSSVGPYAAHAVPVFALRRNLPLVDWVIARVMRRYFGLPEGQRPNGDEELWDQASRLIESGRARDVWLGTLDFAAAVCKPRPRCPECPLRTDCAFFQREIAPARVES
jgi:A/G-specific adenine glycosylase